MAHNCPIPPGSPLLRDESRFRGWADDLLSPPDPRAAIDAVGRLLEQGCPLTFQGARTGLCGAAVPQGGTLVSVAALDKALALEQTESGFELRVQPGYRLADLRRDLASRRPSLSLSQPKANALADFRAHEWFWPPDPGESGATMGGLASTGAAGPNRARLGEAGDHIAALSVVFHDGQERIVRKGQHKFGAGGLALPTGETLGADPLALGLGPEADLLDLIIGGQGMLGFVTGLWLALSRAPAFVWGLVFFLEAEERAAALIENIIGQCPAALVSLDYLDQGSLATVAGLRRSARKLSEIPEPPKAARAAVMIELMANEERLIEEAAGVIVRLCQDAGGDPDDSWALVGPEVEKARLFRHAVPEGLGGQLDEIRAGGYQAIKTASDLTRPGLGFSKCLAEYRRDLSETGLTAVIFGHASDNHLHVNFLPKSQEEAARANELTGHWLERAKLSGGKLFAEQGVGKTKKALFLAHERPAKIAALREAKRAMDPKGLFNPHNLFD